MNKIFKTTYSIAMLLLLVLTSCLKQNLGDFAPDKVNDLTISGDLKDTYMVNVGDVLKLDAKVEQSQGNGSLTYQWYYYSTGDNAVRVVVSNTAQLDLKIEMATGSYILVAESTDTKTGVKAYKKMALKVKRFTSEGWLILTWKDNKANMSIVSSDNDVLRNFLIPSTEYPINSKPQKLFCVNHWDNTIQPIAILTAQPKLFFLDRNTFEVHNDETTAFSGGGSPIITNFGTDMYFNSYYMWDIEGQVYQSNGGEDANYPSGFDQSMSGNYKASKFVLDVASGYPAPAVFYDEEAKRFLYQGYGGNELLSFNTKPVDAPFNVSNFTDEIKFAALGASEQTYIVGKSALGQYNLYTLALSKATDIYPASSVVKLTIPNNGNPSFYAVSGKLPLLYYIVDNSLYLYKMGEKTTIKLYTFPAEETVAAFQMFRETLTLNEASNPLINNRLVVAVNNGSEGIFYTFDLSATGALKTGRYATRNDGFDPIIDIAYKMLK